MIRRHRSVNTYDISSMIAVTSDNDILLIIQSYFKKTNYHVFRLRVLNLQISLKT